MKRCWHFRQSSSSIVQGAYGYATVHLFDRAFTRQYKSESLLPSIEGQSESGRSADTGTPRLLCAKAGKEEKVKEVRCVSPPSSVVRNVVVARRGDLSDDESRAPTRVRKSPFRQPRRSLSGQKFHELRSAQGRPKVILSRCCCR
jgi:hypothetical protein